MKKVIGLLTVNLVLLSACSDDDDALSGVRYLDDVFNEVNIAFDLEYGAGAPLVGTEISQFLDIYQPVGDDNERRPTILLAHGGAFVTGTKGQIRDLCNSYARKGYTVASMSYRLINDPTILNADSVAYAEGVVLTLSDMKAAIRYLRNDALTVNSYNIDPNMIIIGGVSAGAVMSMNVGFLDESDNGYPPYLKEIIDANGGIEGNTNDINVSSEVQGIISYSGSVFRDAWIDSNDPPIFMVHDEFDPVVPCAYEDTNVVPFPLFAYGSCSITDALDNAGVTYEIMVIAGSDGHVSYFGDDEQGQKIIDQSAAFLVANVLN
ncbi:MAG: alpha/beta hydrolase [Bacteroidota bacterium]